MPTLKKIGVASRMRLGIVLGRLWGALGDRFRQKMNQQKQAMVVPKIITKEVSQNHCRRGATPPHAANP